MNCQHCGAELTNKRAKNCATCSAILAEANRAGTYGFVMEAIAQAKADGLTGAAMIETMRDANRYGAGKRAEFANAYRARQAEKKAETSAQVAHYMQTGRWTEDTMDEEDADMAARNAEPRTSNVHIMHDIVED